MHAELLDGAGAEGVAGGDEYAVVVLQQEEAYLGEIGGFADAVHADYGDDIWSFALDGLDFVEKIERSCWCEHFAESGFHSLTDGRFDT